MSTFPPVHIHQKISKDVGKVSNMAFLSVVLLDDEKATQIWKKHLHFLLNLLKVNFKSTGTFCQIFVAFLENLNFIL